MRDCQKMNLRSKVSVSVCLLIVVSIFVYFAQIPAAHSWGSTGHRFIENKAERVFSDNSFFSNNHNTLYTWCTKPDEGWGNSDWHYLDGHSYDPLVYTGGALPWAVENIFENLVRNLQDNNWNNSAQLMGALCHFAGDSTQPLHSTYNYNPNGMHSAYESTALNAHLSEISIPDNYLPQKLDNVLGAALASLAKSFTYTAEGANPGDNNLTDFLDNGITWNDWIKSMTENRLRSAVQFTANIWYSAMIQAGLTIQAPTLTSPSNGSSTTDNTPTFTWTSVSGTSSYDFQLASDNNFTINARTVKGLATASYTPVNPLTNGGWYWHVRTGDNSTDVGLWSQIRSFTVSVSNQNAVVVISPSSQSGTNGATLTYTVTVTNTENTSDNFNLTAGDNASPSWGPTVSPTSLTIPAGENRTSTLNVTVPSSVIGGTIDNVTVTATGTGASGSGSCTAQATIARGVQVAITPPSQENDNGGTLKYDVLVKNLGNVQENFQLTRGDNTGWTLILDNNWLLIPNGDNRTTKLNVSIPSNAIGGTWDNIWVKATSKDNAAVFDNKSCLAHVRVVHGVEVSISPSENGAENGQTVTFTVTVKNTGINPDNYNLTVIDNAGWGLTLDNNRFENVLFGENRKTTLRVAIPDNATLGTHDNITLTATSQGDPSVKENTSCIASAGNVFTLDFVAGWNLVSFPLVSENDTPNNIFGGQTYNIWEWDAVNKKYVSPASTAPVELGVGYWIWVGYGQTVTTSGVPVDNYSIDLVTGWNLMSSPVTSPDTTPANLFAGQTYFIWKWDAIAKKYIPPITTAPVELGVGYWIWVGYGQSVTVPVSF